MKLASYIVIHGKKNITDFMKAADLFQGTNYGFMEDIVIAFNDKLSLDMDYAKKIMYVLKTSLEKSGSLVSLIHLDTITINDDKIKNKEVLPYFDNNAREISNGKKSFLLKDFIDLYTPFSYKLNDHHFITEIIL